jgi:hypothetical protein
MPEAIDIVVTRGSPAIKTWMTMENPLNYTSAQIDALLRDPVAAVQIGVLRRQEVQITRAQYDQGVNHSNENLAFWYRMRDEFVPSAEQIEKGLSSPDETTRRGWVLGKHYHLTDSQVARVWQDDALRGSLMSRTDFVLSREQTDACTVDPSPSIRMACVQRADYELTHQRFEHMLLDSNPNVLGDFLWRKEPRVNLAPFVEHAMQNGNNLALMAIARNNKVPVSEADVQRAQSHANAAVRLAFCKRQPQVCANQNSSSDPLTAR